MGNAQTTSRNVMAELLDLPVVSAGLRNAQSQGVHWGQRLQEQYGNDAVELGVEHAIRSAMWRTAGTGALAGLGGVLTLPAGGGDLLYFLYAEIELSAAIFTLFGIELDDEQHRPILMAAAMGLGVNELVRLLGSRLGERAARQMLRQMSVEVAKQLQKLVGKRLVAHLAKRGWLGLGRLVPLTGAVVGGGLNAVLIRTAGEAMRHTAKEYKRFLDEHQQVETVDVVVLD